MSKRLRPTVSNETYELILKHAKENNMSQGMATSAFIEAGAKSLYGVKVKPPPKHGDISRINRMTEYKQCPQCDGWNVGIYEGDKCCADCGWKDSKTTEG